MYEVEFEVVEQCHTCRLSKNLGVDLAGKCTSCDRARLEREAARLRGTITLALVLLEDPATGLEGASAAARMLRLARAA